ncbi:F-box protein skip23 [Rhynchospora pubera]|uniref:F-box protein skip23 n=1 Tax=Rhynchospora pubera TaxID=906938 RepID=A0AAV8D7Q5_9POAL|nr:F-box protein skip23 [Rhynchospora pubera]
MKQGFNAGKEIIAEARDWSDLQMDLISLITKKLCDLPDFTRFRTVCKTWSSAPPSGCPPQFPWLLEWQGEEPFTLVLKREQKFYSLFSGETGKIRIDECHCGKEFRGPCQGYLILLQRQGEYSGISLFNPLTKDEISLPPLPFGLHWPVYTNINQTGKEVVVVDQDLFKPGEKGKLGYHRADNNEWIHVEGEFRNCCYSYGMFFSTKAGRETEIYNLTTKKLLHKVPPPEGEIESQGSSVSASVYLVGSSEEILRVSWYMDWNKGRVEESVFHIHRLDIHGAKGHPFWVKISSIDDRMIFLDEFNGFSISAKPFTGFQGNCIYFLHHWLQKLHRYDIKSGIFETVPCPFEECTWFVPSLEQISSSGPAVVTDVPEKVMKVEESAKDAEVE